MLEAVDRNSREYWQEKINITSKCPLCQEGWTRDIHPEELRSYQALVICPSCSPQAEYVTIEVGWHNS